MVHTHTHHTETKNIKTAFFLNLIFTIIEIIGGIWTNSVAIIADAVHDLGDSLSLGLSWYFQNLSDKGRDKTFSYGYKRFSLLGAVINAIVLLVGSVFVLYQIIPRIYAPEQPHTQGMIILAIGGVVFNGLAVMKLHKGSSLNTKVVSWHLMEDVLGWVAVLVGAIVMHYFDLPIIDPLLSLLIIVIVVFNVFINLKKSLIIILQGTPADIEIGEIRQHLQTLPEIKAVHDCHLWSMDGAYNVFTVHLVVMPDQTLEQLAEIKLKVREVLKTFDIPHATIEFEAEGEPCKLEDC